jgi:elongation factor 3
MEFYKKVIDINNVNYLDDLKQINPCIMEKLINKINEELKVIDYKKRLYYLELVRNIIELYPKYVVYCLPELIIQLRNCIQDTKSSVRELAMSVFKNICYSIDNPDIQKALEELINAYIFPITNTTKAIDALYSTTYVNEVDTQILSIIIPILLRSTTERNAVFKRRACVIMDNLFKLISDPKSVILFYEPVSRFLNKIKDEVQFAEIRKVADNALLNITKLYNENKLIKFDEVYNLLIDNSTLDEMSSSYLTDLLFFLVKNRITDIQEWNNCLSTFKVNEELYSIFMKHFALEDNEDDISDQDLCNVEFSLAYGSIVLLHKTKLHLKYNHKYALVGKNGSGKTTLMRSIAQGTLESFPEDIKTCYIAHDIEDTYYDLNCIEYIIKECQVSEETAITELQKFNFDEIHIKRKIGELSGGWKMKLNLSMAIISKASLLLLDEPTNHLDVNNVKWLTEYLQQLRDVSILIVSHEPAFLNAVCTDIIHYEANKKLKKYKGNLNDFIKVVPEAKYYDDIKFHDTKFSFPQPGVLEGVKSLTKAVLKMDNITFTYPNCEKPQLQNVYAQCSLASRIAIVGPNGAGKSTLIKLLMGEMVGEEGEIYKHPNLRVAYVSQQAFKNIDEHLNKTPVQYIQWRYSAGVDKEALARDALQISPEEELLRLEKLKERKLEIVQEIVGRKYGKRDFEYEVKWENSLLDNSYLTRKELEELGYTKLVMEFDEKLASEKLSGHKKLTTGEIQRHLEGFNINAELGTHNYISALSSGQRMRCALAANFWFHPHILIADEPTNYLDRESVASLMAAIETFEGGVVIISHNEEFTKGICKEVWHMENGKVRVEGSDWMIKKEQARLKAEREAKKQLPVQQDEKKDIFGNTIKEEVKKLDLDRKQRKVLEKKLKEMKKQNLDTYDLEVKLGLI